MSQRPLARQWPPAPRLLARPRSSRAAHVVGPICESGDTLGYARLLAPTEEGHVLLIATAAAYGHAMSSRYNLCESQPRRS